MPRNILLIEDNADLAHLLPLHLVDLDCNVDSARDGAVGLQKALTGQYELIILDLLLPQINGIDLCQRVRRENITTPILMLTSKSSELDRVLGLEVGADDYLTKPFSMRELLARVKAILRRQEVYLTKHSGSTPTLRIGSIVINTDERTIELDRERIELTAKEFDLLLHFASNPNRVFTRSQLLDAVWGYNHDGYEHTVNSHINRLRAKIESDPRNPDVIVTVWGIGYKLGLSENS
ncbi:response regulator transcription factor [Pelagibius sp. Alg239-R121]|uniref:response regulator transcription factor n=1 Tax=Pelagibius sp. Alg239-R121 TaxID=2993448 RepID=UPI0024A79A0C|nr:response regulator transcription factor [Pelagibius sp. Alg239-R121]